MQASTNVQNYYDTVAGAYDGLFTDPLSQAENRIIQDDLKTIIRQYNKPSIKILDLGCGTGLGWELVKTIPVPNGNIIEYYGVDISGNMIDLAKKSYDSDNIHFFKNDMASLPIEVQVEKFDIIMSLFGSFSHVMEPEKVINNLTDNLLNDKGTLYLMTYSRYSLRNLSTLNPRKWLHRQLYSIRNAGKLISCPALFYSPKDMRRIMHGYGRSYHTSFRSLNALFEISYFKQLIRCSSAQTAYQALSWERRLLGILPQLGHSLITIIQKNKPNHVYYHSSNFGNVTDTLRKNRA